jgi:hypothetical protein
MRLLMEYFMAEITTGTPRVVENDAGEVQIESASFLGTDSSHSMTDMMVFPDEPFPDYDWAANFDFADFNWTPNTFTGTLV